MTVDVLGYLQSKNLHLKRASGEEVNTACFFHGEDPQARGRLYINVNPEAEIPGLFFCQVCGEKGSIVSLKKHFGDPIEAGSKEELSNTRMEMLTEAADFYHRQLGLFEDVFSWLRGPERGLEIETIVDHQLGYAYQDNGLYKHLRTKGYKTADMLQTGLVVEHEGRLKDSFRNMVTIPYMVAGNVVMIRGRAWPYESGPKYKTPANQQTRLFNSDKVWGADELVVCEGEFDAMVMEQLGFNAVGVPGARIWQDAWDGYVTDVRRIWLVFDRDTTGEEAAKKLVDRFGPKVRRVHLSELGSKCDPTSWVAQGNTASDFKALTDVAAGGLLITVDQAREEHTAVQGVAGIKFGIELLDLMIAPGLLPGQICVPLAKAGTGKTLLLLNLMQSASMVEGQEDLGFLFLSLEQTRSEWWERARRIFRFYNLDATDEDALDYWRDRLLIVDKNRLTMTELHGILDDYEYRTGKKRYIVMLDYLGYWSRAFKGEAYQRTSDAVMALKEVAKDRRIPLIAPHQVSRIAKYGEEPDTDAARDAGVVEETADFIWLLWSPDATLGRSEEEKSGIVKLKIGKSRHGGRGVKIDLQLAPVSLALVPHGQNVHTAMARRELEWERRYRDPWENVVYRHRMGIHEGKLEMPA